MFGLALSIMGRQSMYQTEPWLADSHHGACRYQACLVLRVPNNMITIL
jgi:hypothetical protein